MRAVRELGIGECGGEGGAVMTEAVGGGREGGEGFAVRLECGRWGELGVAVGGGVGWGCRGCVVTFAGLLVLVGMRGVGRGGVVGVEERVVAVGVGRMRRGRDGGL